MTRMISITDTVYDRLKTRKEDKSFSELLDELMDEKAQRIRQFAGILEKSKLPKDTAKWVRELRDEEQKADQKRWKELEKHWKG